MFTEHDYDPDDDLPPFGTDFKGDDIEVGEEDVVSINGELMAQANNERYKDNVRRTLGDLFWQQFAGEDKTVIKVALEDLKVEIEQAINQLEES